MQDNSINSIAETFGLTVETGSANGEDIFKLRKGVNIVVAGNEETVRKFLSTYESDRPGMLEASMYGYKE